MTNMPSFTVAVRHRRLEWVRRGVRWAAWLVGINGALALVAAALGPARASSFAFGVVPMSPWLAVAHVFNGVALWAYIARRQRLQLGSAVAAVAASVAAVVVIAVAGSAASQPPVAGTLPTLVAAIALTVLCVRGRPDLVQVALGAAGFGLMAMSIIVVGVRLTGAFGPESTNIILGASAQGVVGVTLLSLSFLGLVWAESVSTSEPPRWVPAVAGVASVLTVLLLWRALDEREVEQLRSRTRLAAEVERDAVYREVRANVRTLRRATERAKQGLSTQQQREELAALVRDLAGLTAAVRVDRTGRVVVGYPPRLDTANLAGLLEQAARHSAAADAADTVLYAPLDDRAEHFALISPVCRGRECDGAVIGAADARALLATAMSGSRGGFVFIVSHSGIVLGTDSLRVPDSRWREDLDLRLGPVRWQLSAIPNDATLLQMRTALPRAVLFMGLIVSALLAATTRLGQQAWRSARDSERVRISAALERTTDAIWEWDLITGEAHRNAGLWRHLGYDPATVAPGAAGWTVLIHPDDRERMESALARHITGETTSFEAEYRVRDLSGNWHVIMDRGRVVDRLADGTAARLLGIRADVTEARQREEARETSERRFRAIFDSGFQFQLLLDADGIVLEVSRAMLERVAVPASEIVGRPVWETLWWPSNAESAARLREQLATVSAGGTVQYEAEIADQAGAPLILEIGMKTVSDAYGHAAQLLLEARDVTERRRVDATLRELDTLVAMGRMAARVAHEINNPLAGIQYSFLLIKDAIPSDHPHYWYAGAIEREIARIATVTRQLYETYRPEKELNTRVSLSAVIGDAVAFLQQVNRATEVRIETDLSLAPAIVPVPSAVLRQVVYNLVQNAMDASPAGSVVRISAVATARYLELHVADEGPGIPPDMRELVFQPFFSTKDARHRTSGMGLGLALVQATVKSAGGRIRIEQTPAGGALFIVTLPFTNQDTAEVA